MADVTGPIPSLPGSHHVIPEGATCDVHADRAAVKRIQGETDSFGCEMHDLCQECYDEYKVEASNPTVGACDWCKSSNVELRYKRDYEEGMAGPVYQVCESCIKKDNARLAEELADYDWNDGSLEYDYFDPEEEKYAQEAARIQDACYYGGTPQSESDKYAYQFADEKQRVDFLNSKEIDWRVTLACVKYSSHYREQYVIRKYFVKAISRNEAIEKATTWLPRTHDIQDIESCSARPFIPEVFNMEIKHV